LPERYKQTVTFEKDEQVTIKIPYTGSPQPNAKWTKNDEEIKQSDIYHVEVTNHFAVLKINKPSNMQSGNYKLNLANNLGSDSCEIKIEIAGKILFYFSPNTWFSFLFDIFVHVDIPEPPRFLVVENVASESVSLSWKPPKSDGGSPITNYIVERLEFNADIQVEATWNRSAITRLTYFIDDFVTPSSKYQYRVIAQNLQGRSTPCEPTSVITTPGK